MLGDDDLLQGRPGTLGGTSREMIQSPREQQEDSHHPAYPDTNDQRGRKQEACDIIRNATEARTAGLNVHKALLLTTKGEAHSVLGVDTERSNPYRRFTFE